MEESHTCLDCSRHCLSSYVPKEELSQVVNVVGYRAGENIIKQGGSIQNRYILCEGLVKTEKRNSSGKKALLSLFNGAEIIEKSCFHSNRNHYPTDAVAITDSTVGIIAVKQFQDLLERFPRAFDFVTEEISRELDFQLQKLAVKRWSGARKSLIWLLVELYQKLNHRGGKDDKPLDLHLSGQDLANMIGVSRETVVIHLSQLRKRGLARATRGSVIVIDYPGLLEAKAKM